MNTNTSLTLYNRYYSPTFDTEKFQRFVLSDVEWEDRKDSNVLRSGGDGAANQAAIYIPFSVGSAYLKPKPWLALSDKSANFSLQVGDIVVKGTVTDELSDDFTPSDLKAAYDDVLRIASVGTMDMGSMAMRHWKVGAK